MGEFTGSALVVQWIGTGGTVTVSGYQKKLSVDRSAETVDVTSGSDAQRRYLPSIKDGSWEINVFDQLTAGTVNYAAIKEGTAGTLVYYPAGTVSGMPKYKRGAVVDKHSVEYPFDNAVERTIGGKLSGAWIWDGDMGDVV